MAATKAELATDTYVPIDRFCGLRRSASETREGVVDLADTYAIFAKVGDLGTISGAARALGLPKANVSRAVVRLEKAHKVSLVDRNTRKIVLTEVGRALHARCHRILEEIEEAEAEIAAHRGHPAGVLRVGCPADIARDTLGPNLHQFLERYPDIDLRLRVGERLIPEPGGLDVVLHAGWLSDSRLIVRKLADIRTILAASHLYVKQNGLPQTIEDLPDHNIIGNFYLDKAASEPGRLPAHVPMLELSRGRERFVLPIWQRFTTTDHSVVLQFVRRGVAIAPIAAVRVLDELLSGELMQVLPDYQLHNQAALYALYADRGAMAPKLDAFLGFVSELIEAMRQKAAESGFKE